MIKKIFCIFVILFIFVVSKSYCINFFLDDDNTSNNNIYDTPFYQEVGTEKSIDDNESISYESNVLTIGSTTSSTPTITTTMAQDNSLSVSDIINIILISVCVVLIFLAIAILIRCK